MTIEPKRCDADDDSLLYNPLLFVLAGGVPMSDLPTTSAVRTGIAQDPTHGAVVPPLVLSANFGFEGVDQPREYDYTRSGNPTRDLLGQALTELEGGAGCVVTASGMAAIGLVLNLLRPGQRIVFPHDCYGGTWRLFDALASKGQLETLAVDLTDPASLPAVLDYEPALVWVETPSNPLLRVTDLQPLIEAVSSLGAMVVVDNTFLTPLLQNPISFGADIVIHSTTKYINGHSDVVGGAVVAASAELAEELAWWANVTGVTGSPFDSYLTLRGLRTLDARLRVHQENAAIIAKLLDAHPAVSRVYYPGLTGHNGHDIAQRQQSGFGAMVSFELNGGLDAVRRFVDSLRRFTLAESLGGVESLIAHPASMTHASMTVDARRSAGIGDGLLRLSVGIEDPADLVDDLESALARVSTAKVT